MVLVRLFVLSILLKKVVLMIFCRNNAKNCSKGSLYKTADNRISEIGILMSRKTIINNRQLMSSYG